MKKVYAIAALVNSGSAKIYNGGENDISLDTADNCVTSLDDCLISYRYSRGYYSPSESKIEIKESSVRTFFIDKSSLDVATDAHTATFFDTVEVAESRLEEILAEDDSLIAEIVTLYKK